MGTRREINIYNLHEFIQYDIIPETHRLMITWDKTNYTLNALICNENSLIFDNNYYKNSLWVNEMKRILEWEEGKSFNISMYLDINKHTKIYIYETHYTFLKIDENGYLLIKPPMTETFKRCHCLYNDLLDEENTLYIMK